MIFDDCPHKILLVFDSDWSPRVVTFWFEWTLEPTTLKYTDR